jgi:hypothetical protein
VVQVEPRAESAWFQRFKLNHDTVLASFAFNFSLRRYTEVLCAKDHCQVSQDVGW